MRSVSSPSLIYFIIPRNKHNSIRYVSHLSLFDSIIFPFFFFFSMLTTQLAVVSAWVTYCVLSPTPPVPLSMPCVQEIQSLLINWKGPDLTTCGELVLEGSFHVQRAKNSRTLFLFQRMLLITKKRGEHYVCKTHISVRGAGGTGWPTAPAGVLPRPMAISDDVSLVHPRLPIIMTCTVDCRGWESIGTGERNVRQTKKHTYSLDISPK